MVSPNEFPGIDMSFPKLPWPVKKFLSALESRDYPAFHETLSRDAAVIEEGKYVSGEAIRAWSESLFADANFALYPIYATETGTATTLIVLRRGTEQGAKLTLKFQQRWRVGIAAGRNVM